MEHGQPAFIKESKRENFRGAEIGIHDPADEMGVLYAPNREGNADWASGLRLNCNTNLKPLYDVRDSNRLSQTGDLVGMGKFDDLQIIIRHRGETTNIGGQSRVDIYIIKYPSIYVILRM